jgi:putative restriction endonuclease
MKTSEADAPPRYWWANHRQHFRQELDGGYLWCAKQDGKGAARPGPNDMTEALPGDVVFSFAEGRIGAIGVIVDRVRSAPNPPGGSARTLRGGRAAGWLLPVRFESLAVPLVPKDHMAQLKPALPPRLSPLRASGERNAAVYLAPLPAAMVGVLKSLLGGQLEKVEEQIAIETNGELSDAASEERIWRRSDLEPRAKRQLISARAGQGVFRENVERIEKLCRVTGVPDRRHLRASHIKPWKLADDHEKLDGFNGLLLSPHIDHLFGRGHISFADDGQLLLSRHLNPTVAKAWGLDKTHPPRSFRPEQRVYLEFHRRHIFEKLVGGRRS